jgi:hypothetical protein
MQIAEQTIPLDGGPFTAIPDYVFDLNLSVQAFRVYMHLKTLHDLGKQPDGVNQASRVCLMAPNSIRKALRELEESDLVIKIAGIAVDQAQRILEGKTPQSPIGFGSTCSWCRCVTAWLHEHHYPVTKSDGGSETVDICPNCHAEFHALTRDRYQIAGAVA